MDINPLKLNRFGTRVSIDNIVCLDKVKSCGAYRTNWPNSIHETGIGRCRCIRAGEGETDREGRARAAIIPVAALWLFMIQGSNLHKRNNIRLAVR